MSQTPAADNPANAAPKDAIADFWASSPETYSSDRHGGYTYTAPDGSTVTVEPFSRQFYELADRTQEDWNRPLHGVTPFDRVYPYATYAGKRVLEIGCGQGGMLMRWAKQGARVTGVDLNPDAIAKTRRRFELFGLLNGDHEIRQADSHSLPFQDGTFDYVYSWGVLHHSPDLERSVRELFRVLKPGGGFGVMLYNRNSLLYRYQIQLREGLFHGESRFGTPLELASRYTDGYTDEGNPHTWPITSREARQMFGPLARDVKVRVLGTEIESIMTEILPGVWRRIPKLVYKSWARRWGWSLWIHGHRSA